MTTPPPYAGKTEQDATPSSEFGATTVSGNTAARRAAPGAPTPAFPTPPAPTKPAAPAAPIPGAIPRPGQHPGPNSPAPAPAAHAGSASVPKAPRAETSRGPRRARLQLRHIDPWTVLKFSCVLSIALFFVWLIVVGVLFGVLDAAGVINKINNTANLINGPGSKDPVTPGIVFGGAAIIGVINIVLFIALSTIGSVVYNLCADLVGGIELTLSER